MELYSCPSPPILKYILYLVTFSKEQCIEKKRKWNLDCRNLANTTLVKWSRTTSPIISHIDSMIWWDEKERHFTSVVFLSKSHWKIPAKPQLREILQNTWAVILKTVKVTRNKENLRGYHGKDAQHHSLSEKCKSKPQWGTISHQSEWLLSKSL